MSDHREVVERAKDDLLAAGVDISGPDGALRVTNLVAWRLQPSYGLLYKAAGFSGRLDGQTYATDYVIEMGSWHGYDVLGDAGGANNPQWNGPEVDFVDRNRANCRAPVRPTYYTPEPPDPIDTPEPPVEILPPLPPIDDRTLTAIMERFNQVDRQLDAMRLEMKAAGDENRQIILDRFEQIRRDLVASMKPILETLVSILMRR